MRHAGLSALAVALLEAALLLWGPVRIPASPSYTDVLYMALLVATGVAALAWAISPSGRSPATDRALSEGLFVAGLILFLFGYIYAANANMDYVQRFAASGGNVRLAPDTSTERRAVGIRYVPVLAAAALGWLASRPAELGSGPRVRRGRLARGVGRHGLALALCSSVLVALSFPSFVNLRGIGGLAYVAYIPLLVVLSVSSYPRAVFYGVTAWTVQTMLTNYWLGTYSLISLQLVTVVLAVEGMLFFAAALGVHRVVAAHVPVLAPLVLPLAWTVFDYLRTVGFIGFPWGLAGASQYASLPVIQIASLTGVWGVGFLVLAVNSGAAAALWPSPCGLVRRLLPLGVGLSVLALTALWGSLHALREAQTPRESVRLALVQQNTDPRKDEYEATFDTLRRLTDTALAQHPDLVIWSETAFVPNIRRWSLLDPAEYPLAALVHRFLAYQKGMGTWLMTGNDDYELREQDGEQVRLDYNAAVLFDPTGNRVRTYHKMRLVPFTESFPWRKELPGLYRLLQSFDVYLWEPGSERVVFEHPRLRFCTPICFEDAFPDHVRRFVAEGLDAIVNISNDYWSLTEVEAWQHAANAVFRAVENRRPVLRSTASGLTVAIDPLGRRLESLPCYVEGLLIVDLPVGGGGRSLYTARGDWFPALCAALLLALCLSALLAAALRRSRTQP